MPAAVRALHRELRWGDAEDGGEPLDLLGGESALPAVAVAFGGAYGGITGPALCLPKCHPCRLSGMVVLVENAAEAVASADVKAGGGD